MTIELLTAWLFTFLFKIVIEFLFLSGGSIKISQPNGHVGHDARQKMNKRPNAASNQTQS